MRSRVRMSMKAEGLKVGTVFAEATPVKAPNGVMSLPLWVFIDDSAQEPRASRERQGRRVFRAKRPDRARYSGNRTKGNRSLREWTLIFGGWLWGKRSFSRGRKTEVRLFCWKHASTLGEICRNELLVRLRMCRQVVGSFCAGQASKASRDFAF